MVPTPWSQRWFHDNVTIKFLRQQPPSWYMFVVCRSKFLDCTFRVPRITMRRLQLSCSVQVSSHVSQCACLLSSTSPGHTQQCQEDQVTLMYLCCRVYACTLAIKYVTKVLLKKNWVIPYKVFNIAQPLFNALIWYFEQNSFYQNCEGLEQWLCV